MQYLSDNYVIPEKALEREKIWEETVKFHINFEFITIVSRYQMEKRPCI